MKSSEELALQSRNREAAEAMALRARECATTVKELFGNAREVRFDGPGHTNDETIEHAVDITPELIARAEEILAKWNR